MKIFFPTAKAELASLARGSDWYRCYLGGSPALCLPMRTFTMRAVEPWWQAVVIDFALHGDHGPASRWARRAEVGDSLVWYAPLAASWGRGYTWRLPNEVDRVLLVADECALPAAAGIIESVEDMSAAPPLTALLEVSEVGDQLPLRVGRAADSVAPRCWWHWLRGSDPGRQPGLDWQPSRMGSRRMRRRYYGNWR